MSKRNPIILIHGLWNTADIFSSITSKLDEIGIEYFAPTLNHSYGMTSIIDLTSILNELILEKFKVEREKFNYYYEHPEEVEVALAKGANKASKIADEVLLRVRRKLGF